MLAECQGRWDGKSGHLVLDHDLGFCWDIPLPSGHSGPWWQSSHLSWSQLQGFHMCRHSGPHPYHSQGCRKPSIAPRPQDGLQIFGLPQACLPLHQGPEHRGPCGAATSAGFAQKSDTATFNLESLTPHGTPSCSDDLGLPGMVAFTHLPNVPSVLRVLCSLKPKFSRLQNLSP